MKLSDNIAVLSDQSITLITGATSGIGFEMLEYLAKDNQNILFTARNEIRAKKIIKDLILLYPSLRISYALCELSDQIEIIKLTNYINNKSIKIKNLVNNAGIFPVKNQISKQGIELSFAINHIAPFLISTQLYKNSSFEEHSLILNINSSAHYRGKGNIENYDPIDIYKLSKMQRYSETKLANLCLTYKLSKIYKNDGILVNAAHPGVVATNLLSNNGWLSFLNWGLKLVGRNANQSAKELFEVIIECHRNKLSGIFFSEGDIVKSSEYSYDIDLQDKIWNISMGLTNTSTMEINND
tara:strand:- start:316 stop:1209 length:894 start_codon:yes stop_codon:yes gene_type:complete